MANEANHNHLPPGASAVETEESRSFWDEQCINPEFSIFERDTTEETFAPPVPSPKALLFPNDAWDDGRTNQLQGIVTMDAQHVDNAVWVATGGLDTDVWIWEHTGGGDFVPLENYAPSRNPWRRRLRGHKDMISQVAWCGNPATTACTTTATPGRRNKKAKLEPRNRTSLQQKLLLASASVDGTVRVWNAATGECLSVLHSDHAIKNTKLQGSVSSSSGSEENHHIESSSLSYTSPPPPGFLSVDWSNHGPWLAAGSNQGRIHLWKTMDTAAIPLSWEYQTNVAAHYTWIMAVQWSPTAATSQLLASAGDDCEVILWEVQEQQSIAAVAAGGDSPSTALLAQKQILSGHRSPIQCLDWCRNGKVLASGSFLQVKVWAASTSTSTQSHSIGPTTACITTEWTCVATLATTNSLGNVVTLAWSPDTHWLALAGEMADPSQRHVIEIWHFPGVGGNKSRQPSYQYTLQDGHRQKISAVKWDPFGGRYLLSASHDRTIQKWEDVGELMVKHALADFIKQVTALRKILLQEEQATLGLSSTCTLNQGKQDKEKVLWVTLVESIVILVAGWMDEKCKCYNAGFETS